MRGNPPAAPMSTLTLSLPPHVDEARARLLLAIALFQEDDLTVGRAADVAGLSYRAFVDTLAARGIPAFTLTFDESDLDFLRRQAAGSGPSSAAAASPSRPRVSARSAQT